MENKSEKNTANKQVPLPEHRAKMAVPPISSPGLELDEHGNPIPLEQRTEEDQEKAAGRVADARKARL